MRHLTPHRSEMAKRNMKIITGIDYMISLNLDKHTAIYYMSKHVKLSESQISNIYDLKYKYERAISNQNLKLWN